MPDQLLSIIVPIAGTVGILVIAIRLGLVIARLGRPATVRQPVAGSSPTDADRPPRRAVVLIFIGIGAALVGGLVGREIARENSVYALLGGAIATFFLVVTIGALVLIGVHRSGGSARRPERPYLGDARRSRHARGGCGRR